MRNVQELHINEFYFPIKKLIFFHVICLFVIIIMSKMKSMHDDSIIAVFTDDIHYDNDCALNYNFHYNIGYSDSLGNIYHPKYCGMKYLFDRNVNDFLSTMIIYKVHD
jgi:hypothetical protein